MLSGLGWFLQVIALVVVGCALVFGMIHNQVRIELAVAGAGGALFLLGRWLHGRGER